MRSTKEKKSIGTIFYRISYPFIHIITYAMFSILFQSCFTPYNQYISEFLPLENVKNSYLNIKILSNPHKSNSQTFNITLTLDEPYYFAESTSTMIIHQIPYHLQERGANEKGFKFGDGINHTAIPMCNNFFPIPIGAKLFRIEIIPNKAHISKNDLFRLNLHTNLTENQSYNFEIDMDKKIWAEKVIVTPNNIRSFLCND